MYENDSFWENIVNVNNSCKNNFDSSTSDDINILIFSRMYLIENLYDKYIYKYNIRVKNNSYDSSVIDDNETFLSAKSLEVLIIDKYINAIININN